MAQVCLPAGCIDAIRVALVDECGDNPLPGENNGYLFNCFRNVVITKNIEDGDETVLKNDCGSKCWQTKKCDELKDIQIEFELLNPDYELLNLLTGQTLINSGVENIGWYQVEGDNCLPWVSLELFEQVPDESCSAGHKYRRLVFPKVRFKLPTDEKEDPFRLVKFEGRTSPSELAAWGTGPFADSPFDFGTVPAGTQSHYMEFFDDSVTDTLDGQCGFIAVPTNFVQNVELSYNCDEDILTLTTSDIDMNDVTLINLTDQFDMINSILTSDPNVTIVDNQTIVINSVVASYLSAGYVSAVSLLNGPTEILSDNDVDYGLLFQCTNAVITNVTYDAETDEMTIFTSGYWGYINLVTFTYDGGSSTGAINFPGDVTQVGNDYIVSNAAATWGATTCYDFVANHVSFGPVSTYAGSVNLF